MTKFVIEVFSGRNSKQSTRHSFSNKEQITLGRSLGCDLIIDDPHACAEHVTISYSDGLKIEDLDSHNGIRVNKKTIKTKSHELTSGDEIHIGYTKIRVFSSDHDIEPTRIINWVNHCHTFLAKPLIAFLLVVMVGALHSFYQWKFSLSLDYLDKEIYEDLLIVNLMIFGLAIMFSISSRLTKNLMRPAAAVSYSSVFFALFIMPDILSETSFASSLNPMFTIGVLTAILTATLSMFAFCVLYLESNKIGMKEWITIGLITISVPLLSFYDHIFTDYYDGSDEPFYETSLPISSTWQPKEALSIEEFLNEQTGLFEVIEDKE
jgi:hypothetical protein